jgi:type I restriction enzyme M protein
MNNIEIKLNNLIDIIRKDSGINNTMDAIEQLSAILLLQYFYEEVLLTSFKEKYVGDFKNLFYDLDYFNKEKTTTDFSKFKNVFRNLLINDDNSNSKNKTWNKIELLLNNIPFRIKSTKILEILLLNMETISFNDELAKSYDALLIKMINESSASGAFYSPTVLVNAIVKVIKPSVEQSIYDPALGTGKFLIESQKNLSLSSIGNIQKTIRAFGQDISPFACLVGSLNLLLNGIDIKNILLEDSLLNNNSLQYDIILSAIPFGKIPNIDKYEYDYKEFTSNLETMFLKLSMKKLKKDGKAALIVPDGLLFNSSNEFWNIRKELLEKFNLHSILSLPSGILFPYSGVKLSVLFFDNNKIENDIWFYGLNIDKTLNKSNQIKAEDFVEFIELYNKRTESLNSCLVKKEDILNKKDLSLNIELHRKIDKKSSFQIFDELLLLKEKKEEFDNSVFQFTNLIEENKKVNFDKTVTLGELFKIKSGKSLTSDKIKKEGKYPVYGGNGIRGYYDEYNLKGENIIIGRVGAYCGNIHFTKEPIWLASNSFSVNITSTLKVYLPYLAHVLRSLNLNTLARGSAQPAISYEKIKDIEISLPSFEQQKELSSWFDEIKVQNENLVKSLELQEKKFNELSKYSIVTNCIHDDR